MGLPMGPPEWPPLLHSAALKRMTMRYLKPSLPLNKSKTLILRDAANRWRHTFLSVRQLAVWYFGLNTLILRVIFLCSSQNSLFVKK